MRKLSSTMRVYWSDHLVVSTFPCAHLSRGSSVDTTTVHFSVKSRYDVHASRSGTLERAVKTCGIDNNPETLISPSLFSNSSRQTTICNTSSTCPPRRQKRPRPASKPNKQPRPLKPHTRTHEPWQMPQRSPPSEDPPAVHTFPRRACIHQHTAVRTIMAYRRRRHRQEQREAGRVRLMDRRISWRGSLRPFRIPRRGDLIRMILLSEPVS
jgi:hypothetical protein